VADPVLAPPAPPYLAVADRDRPDVTLGFVHRPASGSGARYEFAPTEDGADALRRLHELVGRLGSGTDGGTGHLPRARCDADGVPLTDADGALVLDGTVAEDDPDPEAWLRSLGAFADALFAVEVVTG
jgi:hypothetical protein